MTVKLATVLQFYNFSMLIRLHVTVECFC